MSQKQQWTIVATLIAVPVIFGLLTRPVDNALQSEQPSVQITVADGATLSEVADSLFARGVINSRFFFEVYVRAQREDRRSKAGRYQMNVGRSWASTIRQLTRGEVMTEIVTIPEGFRLNQIAPRIARLSRESIADVTSLLASPGLGEQLGVPGPGAEGYLFPDTYRFAEGVPVIRILSAMVERYHATWTPERRTQLSDLGMTERELVTLASIIQAEARLEQEMPHISGVFHNRLERGWLLQADPTVTYALGGYRERLLFAAIDSVADSPYNTYRRRGLPPGPIGAPGEAAIDAALNPVREYMYFVARPDGSHIFTRSLAEHNQAQREAARGR